MKTVLLTNGQQRKTLAAARSLGKRGIQVIAAEETSFNPTAFSKYCSKFLVCPSPKKTPEDFYKWLYSTIVSYKCDILFPMDDDTMEIVIKHYEELSKLCVIPVAPKENYEIAKDKGRTFELAIKSGVSCPDTISPSSVEELKRLLSEIKFPAIIKPRISSGSRGIRVVNTREELLNKYLEVHEKYSFPIIQDFIAFGDKYSVNMLFDKQYNLKAAYVQKYLRTFPVKTGPSTLTESIEYPELLDMAVKIAKNIKWYGVMELEFIVDTETEKPYFMEINPRFWASVQGAIFAGVDFPWLLYKVALEEDFESVFTYKTGSRCRWLLPGDILHFLSNKNRFNMDPPFLGGKKYGIKDDIASRDDPMPVLGFFLACLRYLFDLNMWRLIFKR
jgi:predicted ATP-grasp superfamily ATP-dependent carboligase